MILDFFCTLQCMPCPSNSYKSIFFSLLDVNIIVSIHVFSKNKGRIKIYQNYSFSSFSTVRSIWLYFYGLYLCLYDLTEFRSVQTTDKLTEFMVAAALYFSAHKESEANGWIS
jgi:hypothetical protein